MAAVEQLLKASLCCCALSLQACGGSGGTGAAVPPEPTPPAPVCTSWAESDAAELLSVQGEIHHAEFTDQCSLLAVIEQSVAATGSQGARILGVTLDGHNRASLAHDFLWDTGANERITGFRIGERNLYVWGDTDGVVNDQSINAGRSDAFWGALDLPKGELTLRQWGTHCPEQMVNLSVSTERWFAWGNHQVCVRENYVERWENPFYLVGATDDGDLTLTSAITRDSAHPDIITAGTALTDGAYATAVLVSSGVYRGVHVLASDDHANPLWSIQLSPSPLDTVASLIFDGGKLFAVGTTFLSLGGANRGGGDAFVAEIDPGNGYVVELIQFGTEDNEWVTGVARVGDAWYLAADIEVDTSWRPALLTRRNESLSRAGTAQFTRGLSVNAHGIAVYGVTHYGGSQPRQAFVQFLDRT